jgi:hypothetical protein
LSSGGNGRGRVVYPLTGPNSLETWTADRAHQTGAVNGK